MIFKIFLIISLCFNLWAVSGSSLEFDGVNDELRKSSSIINGRECTLAVWFNPDAVSYNPCLIAESHTLHNTDYSAIFAINSLGGDSVPDDIRGYERSNSASLESITGNVFSVGEWSIAIARYVTSSDRSISLNGGARGTNTSTLTLLGDKNIFVVGFFERQSGKSGWFNGKISCAVAYSIALTKSEEEDLANGVPADFISPNELKVYIRYADSIDSSGNENDLTSTGPVVSSDGPPVWIPIGVM